MFTVVTMFAMFAMFTKVTALNISTASFIPAVSQFLTSGYPDLFGS